MKEWHLEKVLREKGVGQKDIDTAHEQMKLIYAIDKLVFAEPMDIKVFPTAPLESDDVHCGYFTDSYGIFAKGIDDEINEDLRFALSKEHGFKTEHHKYITRDVMLFTNAVRLVRYRVQDEMGIMLLRPEHAHRTNRDLELLQTALTSLAYSFVPGQESSERQYDADVISTYGKFIAIEAKMENLDDQGIAWQLSKIVQFDARLLEKKRGFWK